MSIERFCSLYPPSSELEGIIQRERLPDSSPVATLAKSLAREGGEGLRQITSRFNPGDTIFGLDKESLLKRIPDEDKIEMLRHWGAVIFGTSIQFLEETLINKGEFNIEGWYSSYNLSIRGTQFASLRDGEKKLEKLADWQWQEMLSLAKEDKTLAFFFDVGHANVMPNALVRFLEQTGIVHTIREAIIPLYKERARFLVVS